VRDGEQVIVFDQGPAEHCNLSVDPGELRDLHVKNPSASEALLRQLANHLRGLRAQADRARQHHVDLREQRERLRARSYVVDGLADELSPSAGTECERP
jgi:hypothetical protein